MLVSASSQRVVPVCSRIIRERNTGVQLNALERGEKKQCLHKVHPNLAEPLGRPILDRNLIRSALAIKFNEGTKYMIRDLAPNHRAGSELAIHPYFFRHARFLSIVSRNTILADAGGAAIPPAEGRA